jgi:hypothetical protein
MVQANTASGQKRAMKKGKQHKNHQKAPHKEIKTKKKHKNKKKSKFPSSRYT